MSAETLSAHVETLRTRGLAVEILGDGPNRVVMVKNYQLPEGRFNKVTSDIIVKVPSPYPETKMDMFWTNADLLLVSGAEAAAANQFEVIHGIRRRRFSRHTKQVWNPGTCNLLTHWALVEQSLIEAAPA